jgi:hypothetical protein
MFEQSQELRLIPPSSFGSFDLVLTKAPVIGRVH